MLVLARNENQRIRIGPDIVITVVEMSGKTVRIGVDAPSKFVILREELLDDGGEISAPAEGVSHPLSFCEED